MSSPISSFELPSTKMSKKKSADSKESKELPKNSDRSAEEIQKDEDVLDFLWDQTGPIQNDDRVHYVPQSIKKVGEKQEEKKDKAKKDMLEAKVETKHEG
jgi:hypothetical protein